MGHISLHPESKVLVIGSDIARYGLHTAGESTQGAGAIAMLVTANPRILAFDFDSTFYSASIMDFWSPVYADTAFVDGKFSTEQYLLFLETVWKKHKEKTGLLLKDYQAICFHLPYTKMGLKGLRTLLPEVDEATQERLKENFEASCLYNKNVGNIYTGSLYLSLTSLLEQSETLQAGDRIGLYSYGSGAVGEFFSGILQAEYKNQLLTKKHVELLKQRKEVTVAEYERIFEETVPTDGSTVEFTINEDPASIILAGISEYKRQYINQNN